MRWSAIAATLGSQGVDTRRDGAGLLVEVFPAAALRLWGLPFKGYKGAANRRAREALLQAIMAAVRGLDLDSFVSRLLESDDALDALVCAIVARFAALGLTLAPADIETANVEGWIHVPTSPLASLALGE